MLPCRLLRGGFPEKFDGQSWELCSPQPLSLRPFFCCALPLLVLRFALFPPPSKVPRRTLQNFSSLLRAKIREYSFSSLIETAESREGSVLLSTAISRIRLILSRFSENTGSSLPLRRKSFFGGISLSGCTWDSDDIETFQKLLTEHIAGATPNLLYSPGLVSATYETMEISTQLTGPERYSLESKDSFMPSYGASWIYNTVVSPSDHSLDDGGDTPLPFSTYSYSLEYVGYTGSAHLFRVYYLPIRANFSSGSFHSSQALELVKKLDIPGMAWKDLYNTAGRYETFCSFPLTARKNLPRRYRNLSFRQAGDIPILIFVCWIFGTEILASVCILFEPCRIGALFIHF